MNIIVKSEPYDNSNVDSIEFVVECPVGFDINKAELEFRNIVEPYQLNNYDNYRKYTWKAEQFKDYLVKKYGCKIVEVSEYTMSLTREVIRPCQI